MELRRTPEEYVQMFRNNVDGKNTLLSVLEIFINCINLYGMNIIYILFCFECEMNVCLKLRASCMSQNE